MIRKRQSSLVGLFVALLSGSVLATDYPLPGGGEHLVGSLRTVEAQFEDTFETLGERHGFGHLELLAANPGIDPWLPGAGSEIVLPGLHVLPEAPREGIVVNLPEYRLYYFAQDDGEVVTYPVGIGREGWSSPIGETRVARKQANPSWYPPESVRKEHAEEGDFLPAVVPPGPDNPMGPYKMNLALSGYVIHGTNKNFGIGMRVSHGCFRLRNDDISALFPQVPVGARVTIVNQPYKLGIHQGELYLEVHTPLDEDGRPSSLDRQAAIQALLESKPELTDRFRLDWRQIRDTVYAEEGIPQRIGTPFKAQAAPLR
ncbi:L,D-transpeptidase family protein [Halopseudomonas nanhaiensis]|uniref:L,D-transpeptidase family protein n=1 Tax=Halopseudomonas nanhaiensis TaxID=2830842 RepID=UPI001CBD4F57|nr:L,D-transpeptidase family protein [Halopseudomonas nanhaiensis]UAW97060.1 L,D-transpeptidase family protein [Halopseudomonas nanhaiensis]